MRWLCSVTGNHLPTGSCQIRLTRNLVLLETSSCIWWLVSYSFGQSGTQTGAHGTPQFAQLLKNKAFGLLLTTRKQGFVFSTLSFPAVCAAAAHGRAAPGLLWLQRPGPTYPRSWRRHQAFSCPRTWFNTYPQVMGSENFHFLQDKPFPLCMVIQGPMASTK